MPFVYQTRNRTKLIFKKKNHWTWTFYTEFFLFILVRLFRSFGFWPTVEIISQKKHTSFKREEKKYTSKHDEMKR